MTKPFTVMVVLEAKPGKEVEMKNALLELVEPSRHEKTCLEYRLHQDVNNSGKFFLYENWESAAAHQAHFLKPYILDFADKLGDWLAKPYEAILAEELAAVSALGEREKA